MVHQTIEKNSKRLPLLLLCGLLLFVIGQAQAVADVAVIANKSLGVDSISAKEAKKIWLSKTKSMGGTTLKLADLPPGNGARNHFYSKVVKKSESKLKAYWAKIAFSGKGTPPKTFAADAEVVNWVAATPGAVGYVDSGATDGSVKVLMISK